MRHRLKRAAQVLGVLGLSLSTIHFASPEGLGGVALSVLFGGDSETLWASGYSPLAFRRLRVGDGEDVVLRTLGQPLTKEVSVHYPGITYWKYSTSPSKGHFHQRWLLFDEAGHLQVKVADFYVD